LTKLEILSSYSSQRKRDSWLSLGSQVILPTTRIFNEGMLYRVNVIGSLLHGSILFCKKEFIGDAFNWLSVSLIDASYGEISFGNNIISPNFYYLLSAEDFEAIAGTEDYTFVPFLQEYQETGVVQIPDSELDIILSEIGVPFISYDELEYPREVILNTMVKPALEEYFKWFPKVEVVSYPVRSINSQEYEFPTGAYDIIRVSSIQGGSGGQRSNILLNYFDEVVWNKGGASSGYTTGGKLHTRTGGWDTMSLDRAARQGMINYATRTHYSVLTKNGKKYLEAYTNKIGSLDVHYAMQTLDWNDVDFARKPEVRKLATSYVLKAFGRLRAQAKSDIPGTVDYSHWVSEADTMKKEVIQDWKQLAKASGIIRGGF
jgi:hypothetical protein